MATTEEELKALLESGKVGDGDDENYIKVPKVIKADGKDVAIDSPEAFIALAQKGHNFEKKMTEIIRPNRQVLQLLETVPGAKKALNDHVIEHLKKSQVDEGKDDPTKVTAPVEDEPAFDYAAHKRELRVHFDLNQAEFGEVEKTMVDNLKADFEAGKITGEYVDLVDAGPDTYEKEIRRAHETWKSNKAAELKKSKGKDGDLPLPPKVMPGGGKDTGFAPDEVTQAQDFIWDLDSKEFEKLSNKVREGAVSIVE